MGSDDLFKKAKALKDYIRKTGTRGPTRDRVLIVCEGKKTEPNYFRGFRLTNVTVDGKGYNTDSLVREAIKIQKNAIKSKEEFDRVWCVFDRDSFGPENFNAAISLARSNNIQIAYSNEAFEIWYMLHFNYYDTGFSRDQYKELLTRLLNHEYRKNSPSMYEELLERQNTAIKNAERLLSTYQRSNPERDNPSTTVHLLVMELNKWI